MLLACKQLNYSKDQTRKLLGEMYYMFDLKTEDEAENQGFEWYNNLEHESGKTLFKEKKPKVISKKITKLPDNYRSKMSIENEKLIKLLRSIKYL